MAGTVTSSSIVKHLASCNKSTRDRAIRHLKTWLPSQNQVSNEELRKIWKGLFYCIWHADKQPVQLELINNLSFLLVSLDSPLSIQYFEVFLITMRREWSGIDYLRLDKFYLLIRRFLHCFFLLMKRNRWDIEFCSRLMRVLDERSLFSSDKCPAQGVNYHVSEIFLDELKPMLPVSLEVFDVLLKPFLSVLEKSSDKVLLSKIKGSMFDCLLKNGNKLLEMKKAGDCEMDDDVEKFGMIALKFGLSSKLFELGSSESCLQGNRKVLFGLHQEFLKLEKDLANAGIEIEISFPQVSEDVDSDEVPDLVPISEVENGGDEIMGEEIDMEAEVSIGSTDKLSKKSKKDKKDKKDQKDKKAKIASGESKKKSKKKKRELTETDAVEDKDDDEKENITEEETLGNYIDSVTHSEDVISNLQMQFEKIAAEVGMDMNGTIPESPVSPVKEIVSKKRKRARSASKKTSVSSDNGVVGVATVEKSGEKSAKKVKFSMKNNLVWKPHSPLPPQNLRLPPSATPRGSALKKGLSPGPIRENAIGPKKVKQRAAMKKVRKVPKGVPAALKRLRKL